MDQGRAPSRMTASVGRLGEASLRDVCRTLDGRCDVVEIEATPEAVLAIRFIAIIAISAGVVSSNEGSSLLAVDGALAELVLASLVLMVAPIYVLQLGIARTSAVSVWILLSIGPCLVFAVQLLDGRLAMSSHTLIGILLYSVFAIWIAFSRKYEQIPKIRVEQPD